MRALMIRWYLCGGWSWLVLSSFIFTLKPFVPNKTYTSLFLPNVELHVHICVITEYMNNKSEETKCVTSSRKSKKNRQHNSQKKKKAKGQQMIYKTLQVLWIGYAVPASLVAPVELLLNDV
jgi:hypothetical protein